MNPATLIAAGIGLYIYTKYYGNPLNLLNPAPQPSFDAAKSREAPAVLSDKQWTASRYLSNVHPNEWYRYSEDPAAVVNFTRDSWKRQDDGYDPEILTFNPGRKNQTRLATGGAQARVNYKLLR